MSPQRSPRRPQAWIPLGVVAAAIPATVLTSVLWPAEDTAQPPAVTSQVPEPTQPSTAPSPAEESDGATPTSTTSTTPPAPTSEEPAPRPATPADDAVAVADQPAPAEAMSREEMLRSRVMTPVPRPPVTPNYSPDVQRQFEQQDEVIDLGTIHPEGQGPDEQPYQP